MKINLDDMKKDVLLAIAFLILFALGVCCCNNAPTYDPDDQTAVAKADKIKTDTINSHKNKMYDYRSKN